jgi:hypothetical protein
MELIWPALGDPVVRRWSGWESGLDDDDDDDDEEVGKGVVVLDVLVSGKKFESGTFRRRRTWVHCN